MFVVPSAFVNGLFTLDVREMFSAGANFPANLSWILSPHHGRYFPLYWLYHAFLFSFCGLHVAGYYLAQSILFLLSALITGALLTSIVRHTAIALLFGLAIFISSPNAESLYTICKAEPLVYALVSLLLLLFYYDESNRQALSIPKCAAIAIAFTAALWCKETAISMFAFAVSGIVAAVAFDRSKAFSGRGTSQRRRYARLLLCLGFGFVLSRLPYPIFTSDSGTERVYTAFHLTWQVISDDVVFYFTQQPDVTGIGMIASFFVVLILGHAKSFAGKLDDRAISDLIFAISLLVMAWSYFAIFLLWRWPMAYYLFLPAIIFRFVAAYGLYMVIRLELCGRVVRVGSCVAMSLLLVHAVIYLWYAGSSQVAYSRVYTDALREYVKVSRGGDSLSFESYPFYAEQVSNTEKLLDLVFHEDRRVYGIADLVDPNVITPKMRELFSISDAQLAENEKNFPKKNDCVLAITGNGLATWQIRGVAPYHSDGSFLQRDGSYDMQELAENRSYFPGVFVSLWTHSLDIGRVYVGYKIYRVTGGPKFTWLGRYPDGWMGRRARLALYPDYVANALVTVAASKYNSDNSVSLFQDDVLVDKSSLSEGRDRTFKLIPVSRKGPTVFRFEVERTFVPQKVRLNRDERELGALIRFEPFAAEAR